MLLNSNKLENLSIGPKNITSTITTAIDGHIQLVKPVTSEMQVFYLITTHLLSKTLLSLYNQHLRNIARNRPMLNVSDAHFRIDFKFLLITYRALHDLAPSYISDLLIHYNPSRNLTSSGSGLRSIPASRVKTRGDRASRLWNDLPEDISESVSSFKSRLETHFYQNAFYSK